jgi:hypothetical protein
MLIFNWCYWYARVAAASDAVDLITTEFLSTQSKVVTLFGVGDESAFSREARIRAIFSWRFAEKHVKVRVGKIVAFDLKLLSIRVI